MKNLKTLLVLSLFATGHFCARAQVKGWGNGADGNETYDSGTNPGINYTDNIRSSVTNLSNIDPTTYANWTVFDLSVPGCNASSFSSSQQVLVIQMVGGTVGTHQNALIASIPNCSTITCWTIGTKTVQSYSLGGSDRVQVVKINQYWDLDIDDGAILTCHPWNGSTGGVMCFMVREYMTVNGGLITVANKGYGPGIYPDNTSVTLGAGGSGGSPSSTNDQAGPHAPITSGNWYISGNCVPTAPLNAGQFGSTVMGAGSAGSLTSPTTPPTPYAPGSPTHHTLPVMGIAGFYDSGSSGGTGAKAGTKGGDGGNSSCPNSGSPGSLGQAGNSGGAARNGGRGGGIMIIKVGIDLTVVNNTDVFFSARGEDGYAGEQGGSGGKAGDGGAGGAGCCSFGVPMPAGGTGGSGTPGVGGDGGAGGNGGGGGTMWIQAQQNNNTDPANCEVQGGLAGLGGAGGASPVPIPVLVDDVPNVCTGQSCPASCMDDYFYDPVEALCLLTTATNLGTGGYSGSPIEFKIGSLVVSDYDKSTQWLRSYVSAGGGCFDIYYTYTYGSSDCADIFEKMAGKIMSFSGGVSVDLTNASSNCGSFSPVEIFWRSANNNNLLRYYAPNNYIEDLTVPGGKRCYISPNISYFSGTAISGNAGVPGSNGAAAGGSDNLVIEASGNWKRDPHATAISEEETNGLKCYPKPATRELNLELSNDKPGGIYKIILMDMSGKKVLEREWKTTTSGNKTILDVASLPRGIYLLELKGAETFVQKVRLD